jgi:hypothetical protein
MSPASISRVGETHAIFAVDPGGTSGVCAGYVTLGKTMKATLPDALTSVKKAETKGSYRAQGRLLAGMARKFLMIANVEQSMRMDRIHLVVEDFVLRMPASTTNLTSCWVAASFATALNRDDMDITWQTASDAKRVNNERLKRYGLYEIGSEHKRDAARHFALKVDKLIGSG